MLNSSNLSKCDGQESCSASMECILGSKAIIFDCLSEASITDICHLTSDSKDSVSLYLYENDNLCGDRSLVLSNI